MSNSVSKSGSVFVCFLIYIYCLSYAFFVSASVIVSVSILVFISVKPYTGFQEKKGKKGIFFLQGYLWNNHKL